MERRDEMNRSLVRIEACFKDSRLRVLADKSLMRRVQGLESTGDSDPEYDPSRTNNAAYRSAMPTWHSVTRLKTSPHYLEDYREIEIPSRDLVIRLILQRVQKMEDDRRHS